MMENTVTIAELKRRGMAAIKDGLKRGPVRILKHNRSAAVVLSPEAYQDLLAASKPQAQGMTALQWLLAHPTSGRRDKQHMDRDLRKERDW